MCWLVLVVVYQKLNVAVCRSKTGTRGINYLAAAEEGKESYRRFHLQQTRRNYILVTLPIHLSPIYLRVKIYMYFMPQKTPMPAHTGQGE